MSDQRPGLEPDIDLTDEDPDELRARAARIRRRAAAELDPGNPVLGALNAEAQRRADALEQRAAELSEELPL